MNWGGTDVSGSAGPLSDVRSIHRNGNTVIVARAVRTTYQAAFEAATRSRWRGRSAAPVSVATGSRTPAVVADPSARAVVPPRRPFIGRRPGVRGGGR